MISHSQKKQPADGFLKPNIGDKGSCSFPSKFKKGLQTQVGVASHSYGAIPLFSSNNTIQTKLSVNTPGDKYEQEADMIADRISQSQQGYTNAIPVTPLHHSDMVHASEIMPWVNEKIKSTSGGGINMDSDTNSIMSAGFGADFSNVKIHTDAEAVNLNRELNANAFTAGRDIYFNAGKYAPGTASGRHLLMHELTHTLQQGGNANQVQKDDADPTFTRKPEIDFKLLPPDFKLRFHHLAFQANTDKVGLDYQTRSLRTGLSYKYGGALTLGLKKDATSTSLGWTPGENKFALGMSRGDFSGKFSVTPGKRKLGLGLHFGDRLLPTKDDMTQNFQQGASAAGSLMSDLPGAPIDPLQYYTDHKTDIEDVSKSVDLLKQVTDSGKRRIRFGADLGLTWDPVSKLAVTFRLEANF